jgi:hypothetical protein
MVAMKRVLVLFTFSVCGIAGADLSAIHSVYMLPMGSALDQFLANRLTSEHVFQVVTDPKLADAVFTDRIGSAFEEKLADLYAPPPSPKSEAKPDASAPATAPTGANPRTVQPPVPLFTETENKLTNPATNSSFGHGKGTIFLVDRKSKQVVWSIYEVPKGTGSAQMDRSASDIVNRLKRDMKKPEEGKP